MNTLIDGIISRNDSTIMLVAVVTLLLVILFVISLHLYAKWFLHQDHRLTSNGVSSPSILVVPSVLWARPFRHLHDFLTTDITSYHDFSRPIKGLESSIISLIPQFVFKAEEMEGLGCVICLSLFENGQLGKKLTFCHHAFHVECIDMWLHSHTTCPICRAPAVELCNNIVLDSLSTHSVNEETNEELTTSYVGETRTSTSEDPSRLEIVVDVQNIENELNDALQRKVISSSNFVY
ncbi:hypothetical protein BUALT_Bualt13G0094500 [Buddleja alternifolia]|uniref:RING-type domain-containing protein n=1 Tax=Buddleja alternifolia TaxID=168488 RepID=A0AAV6WLB4_9LAMI|nr:hypothetical protein BUALT_Bualt13G0094500 [Buddleja alternifolia]